MALNTETQARIELLVGIDRATYGKVKDQLRELFEKRNTLDIDMSVLKDFAAGVKDAIKAGGADVDASLTDRFDNAMGGFISDFAHIQKQINDSIAAGDAVNAEIFLKEKGLLEDQIKAEVEAHKKRVENARKLKDLYGPSSKNLKASGDAIGEGFMDIIGKAKGGDIKGLAEAFAGQAAKGLKHLAEKKSLAAGSAESAAMGEALAAAAAAMTAAAAAITLIGGAIAGALAILVMLDDQAKELNKTLMEGASIADFSALSQKSLLVNMTRTLDAARKASIDMAYEMRGTSDEMTGVLSSLNQAGFSFKEIASATRGAKTEVQAYTEAIRTTFKWATTLGVSIGEVAENAANWSEQFGSDLQDINDKFASIGKFAMVGGFNVKRFFTAVSQATSGMAIYNARMEEAGFLLLKTQKILGGTDASDFIKSLTQGFADEGITDRIKRIMIAGGEDTSRIFKATAERTAESFIKTFQGSNTQAALESAFKSVGVEFSTDPGVLKETWGKLDAKSRRLIIGELRANGNEQSDAAARQLETLGRAVDAAEGGMDAQVRGMAALDMQGKLAYKLQSLGDKRLNDMSMEELAAFESYAGISGAQLEQLMRVESQLMADYELAKKNDATTAQSFEEYVATNKEAQDQLEGIKDIQDSAEFYSQKTVENTRSIFSVLKNTIAGILNDIYTLLTDWMGYSRNLSPESIGMQADAVSAIREQRDAAANRLEEIDTRLGELDKTISTSADGSDVKNKAIAEKAALENEQRTKQLAEEYFRAQERKVYLMDEDQLGGMNTKDDIMERTAEQLQSSGEALEMATANLSAQQLQELSAKMEAAKVETTTVEPISGDFGDRKGYVPTHTVSTVDVEATRKAQADILQGIFADGQVTVEEQTKALDSINALSEIQQRATAREMKADKRWRESGYYNETLDSDLEALKRYEGWRLATEAGVSDDQLEQAISEYASGAYAKGQGIIAHADGTEIYGPPAPTGNDFVMRPGQPAQRFNPSDTVLGMKPGGPIANSAGNGPVTININVNGGDQAATYRTVKDALKSSGLRP